MGTSSLHREEALDYSNLISWTITMRVSLLLCLFVLWLNMDVSLSQNEPAGCQTPPTLTDGDLKYAMKSEYGHNERVEYMCQNLYTMEGDPHRTCTNGQWTGRMRCLRPCTVNHSDMAKRNIAFRYGDWTKMYVPHNDVTEFKCTSGAPYGTAAMRVRCTDGAIPLPLCQ